MSSRRIIILIVAVVVGILASATVYTYVNNVKTEAAQEVQKTTVWQVTELIPKGTSAADALANGFIAEVEIEVGSKPTTAIDDPDNQIQGLVAVIDIPANVALVQGLFVEPGVVDTGITDRLESRGMVTMTFQVDQIAGVANMVEPGDRVNILVQGERDTTLVVDEAGNVTEFEGDAPAPVDAGGAGTDEIDPVTLAYPKVGRYVYQYVEVLAVGQNLTNDLGAVQPEEGAPAAAAGSGVITVAVPPDVVPVLISIDPGRIYLSLVPQDYVPIPNMGVLDLGDNPDFITYPGEREGQETPYPLENQRFADLAAGIEPAAGAGGSTEDDNQ